MNSVGDRAHSNELFVELPASHIAVLLPLVVGEQTGTERGTEGVSADEHPALKHELREADAPKESRLSAAVSSGDDYQRLVVRVDVVSDDGSPHRQSQADVAKVPAAEGYVSLPSFRKGDRLADLVEPLFKVEAGQIEPELRPERLDEVQDVFGRLVDCVGDED